MACFLGYGGNLFMSTDDTTATLAETAQVRSIDGPTVETEEVDCTTLSSSNATREFILGLIDPGNMTFDIAWDPALESHQAITDALSDRANRRFKVILTSSTAIHNIQFPGRVNSFSPAIPIDDILSASVGIRLTGSITWPTTV